jgi:hypothetical protein
MANSAASGGNSGAATGGTSGSGNNSGRRHKRSAPKDEPDKIIDDEEEWNLKDVIFVEDSKNGPAVGRVIKVDGPYAAVKFSTNSGVTPAPPKDEDAANVGMSGILGDGIRLLRKDDLQARGSFPEIIITRGVIFCLFYFRLLSQGAEACQEFPTAFRNRPSDLFFKGKWDKYVLLLLSLIARYMKLLNHGRRKNICAPWTETGIVAN